MASVSLESVSKVFAGGVTAVNEVTLQVEDGELLVLLGPSGCGKSTTLRMVAGLEEVSGGEIRIGDRVVNDVAPKDRDIAMVFQNYALYPHMTVYKNMAFGLELRYGGNSLHRTWKRLTSPAEAAQVAVKRRGIREAVRQTAQALRIEHLLDRMPRQLSGGERQRVALGRAIVRQPAVFLLDEPLSNLDAKLRLETRRELHELHHRLQTTMIYVTHDQTEAMTLGQRIVIMNHGEIQQVGTPMEVYNQPKTRFVAEFIGSPPMNFVSGRLVDEAGCTAFRAGGMRLPLDPQSAAVVGELTERAEVDLGVRAEDVKVQNDVMSVGDAGDCGDPVATVTMVEPLGDCKLLHVAVLADAENDGEAEVELVSKVDPRSPIERGDRVRLSLVSHDLHWFDATTGNNLMLNKR